jgi:hypothetical protein
LHAAVHELRTRIAEDPETLRSRGVRLDAIRALAKGQDNIRGSLLEGERVELIVIEHYTATRTIVMTDRRALVMRKSGRVLERALTRNDIRGVELRLSPGTSYVVISGPGTVVRFHHFGIAKALRGRLDALVAPPRPIPVLYPDYFLGMLTEAGMPTTPTNITNLVERVFVMLQGQAKSWFDEAGDHIAPRQFEHRFGDGGPGERTLHVVDDVVDWLWRWNTFCHEALVGLFPKIRAMLLAPGTILHSPDGRVPSMAEWHDR